MELIDLKGALCYLAGIFCLMCRHLELSGDTLDGFLYLSERIIDQNILLQFCVSVTQQSAASITCIMPCLNLAITCRSVLNDVDSGKMMIECVVFSAVGPLSMENDAQRGKCLSAIWHEVDLGCPVTSSPGKCRHEGASAQNIPRKQLWRKKSSAAF